VVLLKGDGVKRDPRRARRLIKRACDGSFEPACKVLKAQGWSKAR
jgi:TPR repeat protein